MDLDSSTTSQELSYLEELLDQNNSGSGINGLGRPLGCGLCGRTMSMENELNGAHQNVSICDDCKFLLLEDFGTPSRNSSSRRLSGRSRSVHGSSDSTENLFSRQFSQIINLARHIEPGHEEALEDVNSRTTPNGSRRWRRILSDTESDVSNSDSYYGESESNISYGAYYHGDSDAVSASTYEGDSDTSVDLDLLPYSGNPFVPLPGHPLYNPNIYDSSEMRDLDNDSDIDPMHAGNVQWDLDDHEQVEGVEWAEIDTEENAIEPLEGGALIITHGDGSSLIRQRSIDSPESVGIFRWRISEVDTQVPRSRISIEEPSEAPYIGDPGNYLDARGFEEFLDHIAETDTSRRGAPPASKSFVNYLPLIVICEEHQKPDGLACAICKDLLSIGTEVNQLPCLHLYHPDCILPWLSVRNSCPICRYELPTDDMEYEQGKCIASFRNRYGTAVTDIERLDDRDDTDDSSSIMSDSSVIDETLELQRALEDVGPAGDVSRSTRGRGGWFLLAAAPIVSLVGIVFVLWLGNPLAGGERGQFNLNCQPEQLIHASGSCPRNERGRRWWWF